MTEVPYDKYLLHLDFASISTGKSEPGQQSLGRYESFYHAMLVLVQTNADLFDRETAAATGAKYFIKSAEVFDLEAGLKAAWISREKRESDIEKNAEVFMVFGPGSIDSYFYSRYKAPSYQDVAGHQDKRVPLFNIAPDASFLYPSPEFGEYYTDILHRAINVNQPPDKLEWKTERQGWDTSSPVLIGGMSVYRPLVEINLYESEAQALRKLISISAGISAHSPNQLIVPLVESALCYGGKPMARSTGVSVIFTNTNPSHEELLSAGRFLYGEGSWKALLTRAGLSLNNGLSSLPDGETLKIGYWAAGKPRQLRPTDSGERLEQAFRAAAPIPVPAFVTTVYERSTEGLDLRTHKLLADRVTTCHTSDLLTAVSRMMFTPWKFFVRRHAAEENRAFYTSSAFLADNKGRELASIKVNNGLHPDHPSGIYFCFDREVLSDGIWKLIGVDRQLAAAARSRARYEGRPFIRVLDTKDDKLILAPIGARLRTGLQFARIDDTIMQNPAYLIPAKPVVIPTDKYAVEVEWYLSGIFPDKTGALHFQRSFSNIHAAMAGVAEVQKGVEAKFSAADKAGFPLQVKSVALCNQRTKQRLFRKGFSETGSEQYLSVYSLTETEVNAYKKHFGDLLPDSLAPPSQKKHLSPPRRSRMDDNVQRPGKNRKQGR